MYYLLRSTGFANETDVEDFFTEQSLMPFSNALGAVVFDGESFDGHEIRKDATITYKIRLRAEQYAGTYKAGPVVGEGMAPSTLWQTSHMFPRRINVGPRGDMYGGQTPG